ncbi:MAG: VWA domain-containing protein [Actinobacteria bacterium]|nr:VWA domain-containing protein [Actinomycetota bacterium]
MRRLLAILLAAMAAALSMLLPGAATADPPNNTVSGSQYLAACMQSARSLSALFILDRSGSLAVTDPDNVRYEGLQTAITELAKLRRPDGSELAVEVAVSAFDHGYRGVDDVLDWTRINDGDTGEEIAEVIDTVRKATRQERNAGTDFEVALEGGFNDITDRGGPGSCRIVLWFTDGEFQNNAAGVDVASARMCAPGGIVDRFREEGIVVVGLQLTQTGLPVPTTLPWMVLGEEGGRTCGTSPIPEGWAPGIYLRADDAAGLKRLLGQVSNLVEGCTPTGSLGATIDPGIRRVRITIMTPRKVDAVRLDTPSGVAIQAPASGNYSQDGYSTTSVSDDFYVSMVVAFPPGEGAGTWRVTPDVAVPPEDIEYCVFSDLHLVADSAAPTLRAGMAGGIPVLAVDPAGAPADLSVYGSVTAGATAVGPDGTPRLSTAELDLPAGRTTVTVTPEPTDARLDYELTVRLETASGLALTPLVLKQGAAVALSSAFPVVRPADHLDLGLAVRTAPAIGTLELMGSPDGPTQVCLEPAQDVQVPDEIAGTGLDYPTGCIDLDVAESRTIEVSVTAPEPTEGNGSASIPIRLVSASVDGAPPAEASYELPVVWRFSSPPHIILLWALIVGSVLLSALPLLAIWLANRLTSRFDVHGLRTMAFPVEIDETGPRRVSPIPNRPDALVNAADFRTASLAGFRTSRLPGFWGRRLAREFTVPNSDGARLVARAPRGVFGVPRFLAVAPAGTFIYSSAGTSDSGTGESGATARATPGLGLLALLIVPVTQSQPRRPHATLVLLSTAIADPGYERFVRGAFPWGAIVDESRERNESTAASGGSSDDASPVDDWDSPTQSRSYDDDFNL